jgi:hypothetical protein
LYVFSPRSGSGTGNRFRTIPAPLTAAPPNRDGPRMFRLCYVSQPWRSSTEQKKPGITLRPFRVRFCGDRAHALRMSIKCSTGFGPVDPQTLNFEQFDMFSRNGQCPVERYARLHVVNIPSTPIPIFLWPACRRKCCPRLCCCSPLWEFP